MNTVSFINPREQEAPVSPDPSPSKKLVWTLEEDKKMERPKIDCPFKVFSIENVNSPIIDLPDQISTSQVFCSIVIEKTPEEFVFYHYHYRSDGKRAVLFSKAMGPLIKKHLDRIYFGFCGTEDVRVRFKSGSGKDKKTSTIRRIVYVKPKRFTENDPTEGRDIDWSHRWQVRGHWRTIQGLGKDRDGDYKVHNHTWVTDHERGPEDAPLVKKTRVVKGEQNGVQVQR